MKKTTYLILFCFTLILTACGGDKENATNVPNEAPTEQETGTNTNNTVENNSANAPFSFTHFDLSVDYAGNKSYDVEYENESTGVEAKIEDDLNNNYVQGNSAADKLIPIFENFTFDAATPNDKIIEEVLNAFNLANDYQEFDLEVRFSDGVEKEVKHTK